MKYLHSNLWRDINCGDETRRLNALSKWNENIKLYQSEYLKANSHLTKAFIRSYESNFGFHHYLINDILLSDGSKYMKYNRSDIKSINQCQIILFDLVDTWQLTYKGLSYMNLNCSGTALNSFNNTRQIEYSELMVFQDDILSHEILLTGGSILLLHFTWVSVKKIHHPQITDS